MASEALTVFANGCEPPCGCYGQNLGSLQEHQVLLSSWPSLQPHVLFLRQGHNVVQSSLELIM